MAAVHAASEAAAALQCQQCSPPAHIEIERAVLHRLHVEAYGGNGGHYIAQLELVERGCLASSVEAEHDQAHLLRF